MIDEQYHCRQPVLRQLCSRPSVVETKRNENLVKRLYQRRSSKASCAMLVRELLNEDRKSFRGFVRIIGLIIIIIIIIIRQMYKLP